MTLDVALVLLVVFVGHWLLLRRFVLPDLSAAGKGLLIVLYGLHLLLIALFYASRDWGEFWSWYLDFRYSENNPSASYAAALYAMVALCAFLNALRGVSLNGFQRLFWLGTGALFGFLGMDEYFALHEGVENWSLIYGAAAGVMALTGLLVMRRSRRDLLAWFMLVGGLGGAAVGAVGLETLAQHNCLGYLDATCNRLPLIEEALENTGILTSLLGVLLYASQHVQLRIGLPALIGGVGAAIALLLVAIPWVVPNLEARALAAPVVLDYLDGRLSVLGYRVSQTVLSPGDPLDVLVYWRVNEPVTGPDGVSVHLVSRTTGQSFAHVNQLIQNPLYQQAAPGAVYRAHLSLTLPPDIPTQASYWLTITHWRGQQDQFVMQLITHTDLERVSPDMAVLTSLPVIDSAAPLDVDQTERYDFQGDLSLTGYSVSLDQKQLALQFRWENRAVIHEPLVQFLHIFDSEGSYVYSVDRPPLTDDFPTIDWPVSLKARAGWQVDLPDTLPPGEYSLRTGLYEANSLNRWSVSDSEGTLLPDGIIELGTIQIEP